MSFTRVGRCKAVNVSRETRSAVHSRLEQRESRFGKLVSLGEVLVGGEAGLLNSICKGWSVGSLLSVRINLAGLAVIYRQTCYRARRFRDSHY